MRVRIKRPHAATYNGAPLPGPGAVLDVNPDAFALHLVDIDAAELVEDEPAPEPKPAAKKRSKATATKKETR